MTSMRALDVDRLLGEAVRLLQTHEWGQGNSGNVCLMSALSEATYLGSFNVVTYWDACDRIGFADTAAGIRWNDAPERTLDEVISRVAGAISADVQLAVPA